jgi:hypothetical protein
VTSTAAAVVMGVLRHAGWVAVFAVVAVITYVDIAVIVIRIWQGARFQPGRDVPPLPAGRPPRPRGPAHLLRPATRKRIYFTMMSVCLVLVVLAWTLIWRYSRTAAVAMSAAAMFIPPFAVIIANAGTANRR